MLLFSQKTGSLIAAAALLGAVLLATTADSAADQPRVRQPQQRVAQPRTAQPRVAQPRTQARPAARTPVRRKIRSQRFECRATCRKGRRACIKANYSPDGCGTQARRCYRACRNHYPATRYAPGYPLGR